MVWRNDARINSIESISVPSRSKRYVEKPGIGAGELYPSGVATAAACLGGKPPRVSASSDTPGTARVVALVDDLVLVADGDALLVLGERR